MKIRKIVSVLCLALLVHLSPCFAASSPNYSGILQDSNGFALLKSAQDGMISVAKDHHLNAMIRLAQKSIMGVDSTAELAALDEQFQQHKKEYAKDLAKNMLSGPLIFNGGSLQITTSEKQTFIDLSPNFTSDSGLANDDLTTMEHAKIALNHIDAAVDHLLENIPDANKLSHHNQTHDSKYFAGATLYLKSPASVESTLQDIQSARNEIMNILARMREAATKSASELATVSIRLALDTQFRGYLKDINSTIDYAHFRNIQSFDGSKLEVEKNDGNTLRYDLPELTLQTLGLKNDDILTFEDAYHALLHLIPIADRVNLWLATGIFDDSYVDNNNLKKIYAKK